MFLPSMNSLNRHPLVTASHHYIFIFFSLHITRQNVLMMDPILDSKRRYIMLNTVVFPIPPKINHHKSLATEITSLYKREIGNHVRLLEKLRVKIMKRVEDLNFLKNCRDKKLANSLICCNKPLYAQ